MSNKQEENIKYIIHMSDLHVRLDRSEEYINVVKKIKNRMYTKNKHKMSNTLIVICGDLLHNISNRGTVIGTLNTMLSILLTISDIVIIGGNHDYDMKCLNKKDELKSILDLLKNKKNKDIKNEIIYYDKSGDYVYKNLIFRVKSLLDEGNINDYMVDDKIVIGLYHGMISGSILDNGIKTINSREGLNKECFKGCDYLMLGDIHKHQYLDKEKRIAYSGSLIQQSYGESLYHGYIWWRLSKKGNEIIDNKSNTKLIIIPGDKGKLKIKCKNNKLVLRKDDEKILKLNNKKITSQDIQYKIETDNLDHTKDQIYNMLKLNIKSVNEIEKRKIEIIKTPIYNEEIKKVNRKNLTINIKKEIKNILNDQSNVKIKEIENLYDEINNEIKQNAGKGNNSVKQICNGLIIIKKLKWKNILCYNDNKEHILKIPELKGIVGILGENCSGKTSIIKILLHGIYGGMLAKNLRSYTNKIGSDSYITIYLEKEGVNYKIHRKLTVEKILTSITYNEVMYKNDERIIKQKTIKSAKETKTKIKELFGTKKDIEIMCKIDNSTKSFIELKKSEITELLGAIIDINSLRKHKDKILSRKKQLKGKIIEKENNLSKLEKSQVLVKTKEDEINYGEKMEKNIILQINTIETELINLRKNRVIMQKSYNDNKIINNAKKEIKIINSTLENLKSKKEKHLLNRSMLKEKKENIKEKLYEKRKLSELSDKLLSMINKKELLDEKKRILTERIHELVKNTKNVKNLKENINMIEEKLLEENKLLGENNEIVTKLKVKKTNLCNILESITEYEKIKKKTIDKKCKYCIKNLDSDEKNTIDRIKQLILLYDESTTDYNYNFSYYEKKRSNIIVKISTLKQNIEKLNINIKNNNKVMNEQKEQLKIIVNNIEKIDKMKLKKDDIMRDIKKEDEELFILIKQNEIMKNEIISKDNLNDELQKIVQLKKEKKIIKTDIIKTEENVRCINKEKRANKEALIKKNTIKNVLCESDPPTTEDIKLSENTIRNIEYKLKKCKEKLAIMNENKIMKNNVKNRNNELLNDIKNLKISITKDDKKYSTYELYDRVFGKNSNIIKCIMSKIISVINNEINKILSELDESMRINILEEKNYTFVIEKNGIVMNKDNISGYEKFMLRIVAKLVISLLTGVGRLNIFIIDEGFGCIDNNNIDKFSGILQKIVTYYDSLFIISHKEEIKKYCEKYILVQKEYGMSNYKLIL